MLRLLALAALVVPPPQGEDSGAARFGFAGFELYRFEEGTRALTSADFNADGRADLALLNEARSRIEVLMRLRDDAPDFPPEPEGRASANALAFDGRFAVLHLPLERRVFALAAADFDADGRAELAYAQEGGELVFVDALETKAPRFTRLRLDELRAGCTLLAAVDLEGDGTSELVAASDDTLLALSVSAGALGAARRLDRIEAGLDQVHALDADGDGLRDLVYVYLDQDYPLRIRLGIAPGRFGPRFDPELAPLRSLAATDIEGDGRAEFAAVLKLSGRCALLALTQAREQRLARTTLEPLAKDARRGFALGDLDGDGAAEIVVAEAAAARVMLYRGASGSRVLEPSTHSSLIECAHPRIGDVDGDGRNELVLISGVERMLGVSRLGADKKLAFPSSRALEAEPVAAEVADLDGDGAAEIAVLTTSGEGRARSVALVLVHGAKDGAGAMGAPLVLEGLNKTPNALRAADVDGDGRQDLVVFVPGEDELPLFLMQDADGAFHAQKRGPGASGLGVLAGAGPERFASTDLDRDGHAELLVAAKNFARALSFPRAASGVFEPAVRAQFNGPGSDSRISAAVAIDWDGDGVEEIALRDERTRELVLLAQGGERELGRIDAGRLDFRALAVADVDGDRRADLVLLGQQELGVAYAGASAPSVEELSGHEPAHANLYLDRLASADLDADGRREVVAIETREHALVLFERNGRELRHALGFRVFESALFDDDGQSAREPRELVAADFSGDGRADLAVLVHDKLVVYLQE
ncbi:MAG: VCBS repeat-containing protein [Planctomycetes bacterium]|nr:VCBS repeat-containing protein [Planctomycetota bacterium]